MLAQVVDQSNNVSGGQLESVKECINANLIEALSKVGDGPSARRIVHREESSSSKRRSEDVVQTKKQQQKKKTTKETSIMPKSISSQKTDESDVVATAAEENSTVAIVEECIDDMIEMTDHDIQGSKFDSNTTDEEMVTDQNIAALQEVQEGEEEVASIAAPVVTKASNALTYAKKIHTYYSNSQNNPKAAPQSLKLLKRMVKSLEERPHQLEPDMWIFNTVLLIWARSGRADSGEVAEEILDMMHHFGQNRSPTEFPYPNDQSYTFVIDAYANSGQKNSGKKALEILHQLQESGWQPNARCLSTTIEAIFKAGDPIPLHLLTQMVDLNRLGDDSSVINSRTFTKAIVSGDAGNALRVPKIRPPTSNAPFLLEINFLRPNREDLYSEAYSVLSPLLLPSPLRPLHTFEVCYLWSIPWRSCCQRLHHQQQQLTFYE